MSPTMRTGRWQKGTNSSHNVSNKVWFDKNLDQDELDTRSATTASTTSRSWPNSDDDDRRNIDGRLQGQQLLGMISPNGQRKNVPPPPPPPPPPVAPPKTRLQSGAALFVPKTALVSEAAPFVPKGETPAAAPTSQQPAGNALSGKDCLKDVVQSAFGNDVLNLSMVECQSFNGDWYTSVEVTIPPLNAALYPPAAQEATASQALQSLLHSLENLSPKMMIMPSEDTSRVSVQYCAADRDMLCWEFATSGGCPRGSSCRWAHSLVETFVIGILLAPLSQWRSAPTSPAPAAQAQREPAGLPMVSSLSNHSNSSTLAALPLTTVSRRNDDYLDDPDDTPWPDCVQERDFSMKMDSGVNCSGQELKEETKIQKRPSGRSWADIQEDSDDDEPLQWGCPRAGDGQQTLSFQ